MNLFRKKIEKSSCCCKNDDISEAMQHAEQAKEEKGIKLLGSGCAKCIALENATRLALIELGLQIDIQHIYDFTQIASYGVMMTPALVIDGKVVTYGKALTVNEVKGILEKEIRYERYPQIADHK